jgi:hypothetical protein
MDVHDYLKQRRPRADSKLFPHFEDLRILYAANVSFATMCKYVSEKHGVIVAIPSMWEFCGRHLSELAPARLRAKRSGATHEARQSQRLSEPARSTLDARDTQPSHHQPTVATTSFRTPESQPVRPEPACNVNAPQPLPVLPIAETTSVQPSEPRVEDTRAHALDNDPVANTNVSQMHRSFTQVPETSPGNIVQADASRKTEHDAPIDIQLFGSAGNLRKPHDLNTPAAKERLARFRKAREEGKI